jgi:hypothetical protein
MILILLNWLLITYIAFMNGFWVRRYFSKENNGTLSISITILWGLCVIFIVSTVYLFFLPAGLPLLAILTMTALTVHLCFRAEIATGCLNFFRSFSRIRWVFFLILLLAALYYTSQPSKISDDGYYYTQTVMWLNRAGLVKGISNLLLPLGLGSSWHVLQAVFSLDFIDGVRFNDLNGFLILVFFFYHLEQSAVRKSHFLNAGFALGLLISIPFLSACSPDLPVILLTLMAFDLCLHDTGMRTFYDLLIIAIFGFSVKLSAIALCLIPFAYCLKGISFGFDKRLIYAIAVCAFALLVVVAKNIYQTGYPFYPFSFFGMPRFAWATPPELVHVYGKELQAWAFEDKTMYQDIKNFSIPLSERLTLLMGRVGYKGIIYKTILATCIASFVTLIIDVLRKVKTRRPVRLLLLLHGIVVINFIVWLLFAPQYRFILPVFLFQLAYLASVMCRGLNVRLAWTDLLPKGAILAFALFGLSSVSFKVMPEAGRMGSFDVTRLVVPHFSYSFSEFTTIQVEGQSFYHVKSNIYCWDSPLPCMSQRYADFLLREGYTIRKLKKGTGFRLAAK